MIEKIKKELFKLSDEKYKNFSCSLLPNINNLIGVQIPKLRKIAKNISKENWKTYLKENDDEFFELTLIEGLIIGYIKIDYCEKLKYIKKFIKKINNWSICDCFCSNLKVIKDNLDDFKVFLKDYVNSDREFNLRFYYVILTLYYIDYDIDYVLDKIKIFNNDKYYAKMAAAWCLSICFVKDYNKTINFIKNNKIHNFVYNKGITKARESLRLNKEQKDELKILRNVTI